MNLNKYVASLSTLGIRLAKFLVALVAIALLWRGPLSLNTTALAGSTMPLATTATNAVEDAADTVRNRSKDLIRDTKRNVEKTANRNASRVDRADDEGTFVERKAQRDQARIERRAEEDAARTEKAVDNSMNAVKGAAERVKDTFGS